MLILLVSHKQVEADLEQVKLTWFQRMQAYCRDVRYNEKIARIKTEC